MRTPLAILVLGSLALGPATVARAQAPRTASAPHVSLELLTSTPALGAATDTWIGVRFVLEPGWHLYWRNPGDSGTAPLLLWTAPAAVTIDDVAWPAPERIPFGSLVNYGYHGEVILPVRVRAAARVDGTLALNASWVVCKDVCVQGKARVALAFPLTATTAAAVPDWSARIAEARRRVPSALPGNWTASASRTPGGFDIVVVAPVRIAAAQFFSNEPGVIAEAAPQVVTPRARGARLALTRSPDLATTPTTLRGVLTVADGTSYEIDVPIGPGSAPRRNRP